MMLAYVLALIPIGWAAYKDWKERIIPNICSGGVVLCGIVNVALGNVKWWEALIAATVLFALFIVTATSKNSGLGGGDIKLTAALGFLLGFKSLFVILLALLILLVICKARNCKGYAFAVCVLLSYLLLILYLFL